MEAVRLSGPAYVLGELVPLAAMTPAAPAELRDRLAANGFDRVSVADRGPVALAAEAVAAVLAGTGTGPSDVDAVLHATCSYWAEPAGLAAAVHEQVLAGNGLAGARSVGLWLAESGNLTALLRQARALLLGGGLRTVLCVTADAVPARPGEYRAMPSAVTVNGDGAAACLLSLDRPGPYELEAVGQHAAVRMAGYGRGQGVLKQLEVVRGVRAATRAVYAAAGTGPADYRRLLTNNYGAPTRRDLATAAGFPPDAAWAGNVARTGHVFAADGLLDLIDSERADPLAPGERVLLVSSGPVSWGAASLRRT